MLRLIVGVLLLVSVLAVLAFVLVMDGAPRSDGKPRAASAGAAPSADGTGIVNVQAAIELPPEYPRRYLNIEFDAHRTPRDGLPAIERVAVGAVDLSGWFAERAARWAFDRWPVLTDERVELAVVRAFESYPERLELVCVRPRTPVEHLRVRAVSGAGRNRPDVYADRIADWAGAASGPRAPVLALLRSLMGEAAERTAAGADPVIENRAALLLAAAQAFGCTPVADGRRVRRVRPVLHRRTDLGRHFVASAALAALLGQRISETVGLDKEVGDSLGFSGFSFSDIAANRAGARFGHLATASAPSARRVQEWMEQAESDVDIMPEVHGLPDHLPGQELKRRFGEPGEGRYEQVLEEIEVRIADIPLYRVSK